MRTGSVRNQVLRIGVGDADEHPFRQAERMTHHLEMVEMERLKPPRKNHQGQRRSHRRGHDEGSKAHSAAKLSA